MTCADEPWLVGIAGPLSGTRVAHAPILRHATDYFTKHGIDFILQDDKADPDTARAVARGFIEHGVKAVVGHFNSACAEAVLPLYRSRGIPLLLPASSQTDLTANGGAFRLCSTDAEQVQLMLSVTRLHGIAENAMHIAIDGSPYSMRLLRAAQVISPSICAKAVNIESPPDIAARACLVFATCSAAIRSAAFLKSFGWNGITIFPDDAHIDEFVRHAPDCGENVFVVGPHEEYGVLMEQACSLIASACNFTYRYVSESLERSGLFSETGNALDATWRIYKIVNRAFVPYTPVMP